MTRNLKYSLKRLMHRIRVWGALLSGSRPSKMSKFVDCIIYELRILLLVTVGVVGFYLFETTIDDSVDQNSPEFYVLMLKFNFAILIVIIGLVFKVLLKMNKSLNINRHHNPNTHHVDINCTHVCHHVNDPIKPICGIDHNHKFNKK